MGMMVMMEAIMIPLYATYILRDIADLYLL